MACRGGMVSSGQLLGYDATKTYARQLGGIEEGPGLHLLASVVSGAGATFFGMPMDFLFTQYTRPHKI